MQIYFTLGRINISAVPPNLSNDHLFFNFQTPKCLSFYPDSNLHPSLPLCSLQVKLLSFSTFDRLIIFIQNAIVKKILPFYYTKKDQALLLNPFYSVFFDDFVCLSGLGSLSPLLIVCSDFNSALLSLSVLASCLISVGVSAVSSLNTV